MVHPSALGDVVSDARFTDIRYLPRTLTDLGTKRACVIVFTTLDCPVVRRYLPRLKVLAEQLGMEIDPDTGRVVN